HPDSVNGLPPAPVAISSGAGPPWLYWTRTRSRSSPTARSEPSLGERRVSFQLPWAFVVPRPPATSSPARMTTTVAAIPDFAAATLPVIVGLNWVRLTLANGSADFVDDEDWTQPCVAFDHIPCRR